MLRRMTSRQPFPLARLLHRAGQEVRDRKRKAGAFFEVQSSFGPSVLYPCSIRARGARWAIRVRA